MCQRNSPLLKTLPCPLDHVFSGTKESGVQDSTWEIAVLYVDFGDKFPEFLTNCTTMQLMLNIYKTKMKTDTWWKHTFENSLSFNFFATWLPSSAGKIWRRNFIWHLKSYLAWGGLSIFSSMNMVNYFWTIQIAVKSQSYAKFLLLVKSQSYHSGLWIFVQTRQLIIKL